MADHEPEIRVTVDGEEVECEPFFDAGRDWWIRCTSPDGEVVYEGVAPVPPELCTASLEDLKAGRFFQFQAFPLSMLN